MGKLQGDISPSDRGGDRGQMPSVVAFGLRIASMRSPLLICLRVFGAVAVGKNGDNINN